jgi:hypothetical protein
MKATLEGVCRPGRVPERATRIAAGRAVVRTGTPSIVDFAIGRRTPERPARRCAEVVAGDGVDG